jgi:4-diphosphocytidyl-2-C-methyl-D-erythritol kinase
MSLAETAYAKINLALHVRKRRADGYHELETLFAFAEDGDLLTVQGADNLSLTISGPFGDGLGSGPDNLVLRAAHALRSAYRVAAGASLHLDKRLPIASGIGGGSADAAAALRLLARFWTLPASMEELEKIGSALGADVPACVRSRLCFGTGVGDALSLIADQSLDGKPILLVNPLLPCPTGPVFAAWDQQDRGPLDCSAWSGARNDLATPAIKLVPEIGAVLQLLEEQDGAEIVRMSGSGATCFALFENDAQRDAAQLACPPQWWAMVTNIRRRVSTDIL